MKQNITFNHYLRQRIPITLYGKLRNTKLLREYLLLKDAMEIFGDHLSNLEPSPSHNECEDIELLAYLESPGRLDLPISEFNVKDVKSIISKWSVKKAPEVVALLKNYERTTANRV